MVQSLYFQDRVEQVIVRDLPCLTVAFKPMVSRASSIRYHRGHGIMYGLQESNKQPKVQAYLGNAYVRLRTWRINKYMLEVAHELRSR